MPPIRQILLQTWEMFIEHHSALLRFGSVLVIAYGLLVFSIEFLLFDLAFSAGRTLNPEELVDTSARVGIILGTVLLTITTLLLQAVFAIPLHRIFAGESIPGTVRSALRWSSLSARYLGRMMMLGVILAGLFFATSLLVVPFFAVHQLLGIMALIGALLACGVVYARANLSFPAVVFGYNRATQSYKGIWQATRGKDSRYLGLFGVLLLGLVPPFMLDEIVVWITAESSSIAILLIGSLVRACGMVVYTLFSIGVLTTEYFALYANTDNIRDV